MTDFFFTEPPYEPQADDSPLGGSKRFDKSFKVMATISIDRRHWPIRQSVHRFGTLFEISTKLKPRSAWSSKSSPDRVDNSLVNCLALTSALKPVDDDVMSKVLALFRKSDSSC